MSVAKTFKNSNAGKVLARAVEHFGGNKEDFEAIVASCLEREILKPSKAKDPKDPSAPKSSTKKKKNSKYTAFQRWCKIFAVWEGVKINRKAMKAIWKGYSKEDLEEWQRVADEMAQGTNLREILNKPEIVVPEDLEDEDSGSESEGESDADDE